MPFELPSTHGDKLRALLENAKLPATDHPRVTTAIQKYDQWLVDLAAVNGTKAEIISRQVALLNAYKRYIELELVFDSPEDFLYRQKGQIKLDNTIIEEFLPILVTSVLANELQGKNLSFGPTKCFSGLRFESGMTEEIDGGGVKLRSKDHDFAISRELFIQTSHQRNFARSVTKQTHISFVSAECKTNLDKTMFQEAAATALDVKLAVPNAKYYLLCEWLDMTPISTSITAIDEILVLRRAKRMSSNIRRLFSKYVGRQANRHTFEQHLDANPFSVETFTRFINHIQKLVDDNTQNVLERGYF